MIAWKLTRTDGIVEYYSKKKELMNQVTIQSDTDYKIQKLVVKDSGDLVFQLKIAQGLKIDSSKGR
mgnify:CR=1 FL=1